MRRYNYGRGYRDVSFELDTKPLEIQLKKIKAGFDSIIKAKKVYYDALFYIDKIKNRDPGNRKLAEVARLLDAGLKGLTAAHNGCGEAHNLLMDVIEENK